MVVFAGFVAVETFFEIRAPKTHVGVAGHYCYVPVIAVFALASPMRYLRGFAVEFLEGFYESFGVHGIIILNFPIIV